jgi:hypothetical protein
MNYRLVSHVSPKRVSSGLGMTIRAPHDLAPAMTPNTWQSMSIIQLEDNQTPRYFSGEGVGLT